MWIYVPSAYSPAQEALTSPSTSPPTIFIWGESGPSVTLNGKSPHVPFLRRALRTDRFQPLQFGRMSQPLMAAAFEAWLTLSTADSPAPTSPSPASKPESPESPQGSGSSTSALFAKFNPDGSLSKTSRQFSIWEQEEPYLENLPASGTMRSGSLYERPTWVLRTSGKEYSSSRETWRTPAAGHPDKGGSQSPEKRLAGGHTLDLQDQAEYWATPAGRDYRTPNSLPYSKRGGGAKGEQLANQVAHCWPTPDANEASYSNGKFGMNLREASSTWPTPRSEDSESCGNHSGATDSLTGATRCFPSFLPAPETSPHGEESSASAPTSRRRLNANFVDWLMGFPVGWSSTRPSVPGAYEAWVTQCARHVARLLSYNFSGE